MRGSAGRGPWGPDGVGQLRPESGTTRPHGTAPMGHLGQRPWARWGWDWTLGLSLRRPEPMGAFTLRSTLPGALVPLLLNAARSHLLREGFSEPLPTGPGRDPSRLPWLPSFPTSWRLGHWVKALSSRGCLPICRCPGHQAGP